MNGWATVIVHCGECGHAWVMSLPTGWDGSPVACQFCGELDGEVAER